MSQAPFFTYSLEVLLSAQLDHQPRPLSGRRTADCPVSSLCTSRHPKWVLAPESRWHGHKPCCNWQPGDQSQRPHILHSPCPVDASKLLTGKLLPLSPHIPCRRENRWGTGYSASHTDLLPRQDLSPHLCFSHGVLQPGHWSHTAP